MARPVEKSDGFKRFGRDLLIGVLSGLIVAGLSNLGTHLVTGGSPYWLRWVFSMTIETSVLLLVVSGGLFAAFYALDGLDHLPQALFWPAALVALIVMVVLGLVILAYTPELTEAWLGVHDHLLET